MRCRIFAFLTSVIVFFSSTLIASAAPLVGFSSASLTVDEGQNFNIEVNVLEVQDLYAWQIGLRFNPLFAAVTSSSEGGFFVSGGGFFPGIFENGIGELQFAANTLLGAGSGLSGSGTIFSVQFEALRAGEFELSIFDSVFLSSSLSDIVVAVGPAVDVTVKAYAVQVPEPSTIFLFIIAVGVWLSQGHRSRKSRN